jgi:LuxR family maltose regulon positive regulatory protein
LVVVPLVPQAKITLPPLPPEFVVRPGLRGSLEASSAADVALVCAPAGYGKTLLLADWSRTSTTADTAWVTVDRDDNDPRRLWTAIVASLDACPSGRRSNTPRVPKVWRVGTVPEFVAELVDAYQVVVGRPIRLVLDDLHELVEPEAVHGLQILVRSRPAAIQLVLSSRCDPPLSLPRLRLTGRLRELRAAQLRFSLAETGELLERSSVHLPRQQVEMLHRRTGGWAAGLRLAALGVAGSADRDGFLAQFSGDERSIADYLVGEVLAGLTTDVQEFLRVISISEPIPAGLAAELSGRQDAGSMLDTLEHETALLTATGPQRDSFGIQELLRTHLLADLRRHGPKRAAELHGAAARWWADQHDPTRALDHAVQSHDPGLLTELLHRFAVSLILSGEHRPLRRALDCVGARVVAADPWLALNSALVHVEAGDIPAARDDVRHAQQSWPADADPDLAVLRIVAEQLSAPRAAPATSPPAATGMAIDELPADPDLEALARLGRASSRFDQGDLLGAGAELEHGLTLSSRYGFDYLAMQCLALQGAIAGVNGDVRTMRAVSGQAVAAAAEHGWECSMWSAAGMAMQGYAALMRTETAEAERLSADGLALGVTFSFPQLQFALRAIHGAAIFDRGERTTGLTELQQARSELGDLPAGPEQVAATAMLEFRAALTLGHATAARTVRGWLAERAGDTGELDVMRGWAEAGSGRVGHARAIIRPVLRETTSPLLPQTMVDAWLLETAAALAAGERPAARRGLQAALAVAERLDVLRPFAQAGPGVRELLVHQHGSFGARDSFAERALAAGAGHNAPHAALSERELAVLRLLPSLLSLGEIAADLTVSVNTIKSHVRSIYAKLGVSSRRLAVLAAHEQGLLTRTMNTR